MSTSLIPTELVICLVGAALALPLASGSAAHRKASEASSRRFTGVLLPE
jgi:hypothetical protein